MRTCVSRRTLSQSANMPKRTSGAESTAREGLRAGGVGRLRRESRKTIAKAMRNHERNSLIGTKRNVPTGPRLPPPLALTRAAWRATARERVGPPGLSARTYGSCEACFVSR